MINLEFATDETKSCKHCYYFNQEGKYCEVQESHTGSNPHPPIPNPEAWTCELYVEPYIAPNNTNTYDEEPNKSPCNNCKYCTGACCYVDSKLIYDRDYCPYEAHSDHFIQYNVLQLHSSSPVQTPETQTSLI